MTESTNPSLSLRDLEVRRRRPGAIHPDLCPKLHLRGVAFSIPPRGLRVLPSFDGPQATAQVIGLRESDEPARLLSLAAHHQPARCRRCGGIPSAALELEARRDGEFLSACFALARRLLQAQYDLSDARAGRAALFRRRPPARLAGRAPELVRRRGRL